MDWKKKDIEKKCQLNGKKLDEKYKGIDDWAKDIQ